VEAAGIDDSVMRGPFLQVDTSAIKGGSVPTRRGMLPTDGKYPKRSPLSTYRPAGNCAADRLSPGFPPKREQLRLPRASFARCPRDTDGYSCPPPVRRSA